MRVVRMQRASLAPGGHLRGISALHCAAGAAVAHAAVTAGPSTAQQPATPTHAIIGSHDTAQVAGCDCLGEAQAIITPGITSIGLTGRIGIPGCVG